MNLKEMEIFIFDYDGVMVDNTTVGINNLITIARNCVGQIPYSFIQKHWGLRPMEMFGAIQKHLNLKDEEVKLLCRHFKENYTRYEVNQNLIQTIDALRRNNRFTGLITSRTKKSLQDICQQLNFPLRVFNFIQTADDCQYVKPDGRVFRPLLAEARRRSVTPAKIVYIGDTRYDYQAVLSSKSALKFIGVLSGASTEEDFIPNKEAKNNGVMVLDYAKLAHHLDQVFGFKFGEK